MSRREFEQVVAQAQKEKMKLFVSEPSISLAAGQAEEFLIYASPNTVAEVIGIRFRAPAIAASSGTHNLYVNYLVRPPSSNLDIVTGLAPYSLAMDLNNGVFNGNMTAEYPSGDDAQVRALKGIQFDSEVGFRIYYSNQTNAAQTAARYLYVTYIEREVR